MPAAASCIIGGTGIITWYRYYLLAYSSNYLSREEPFRRNNIVLSLAIRGGFLRLIGELLSPMGHNKDFLPVLM